ASKTRHSETPNAGSESVNDIGSRRSFQSLAMTCIEDKCERTGLSFIGALLHRRQIFDWKHHALVLISYVKNLRNRRSLLVPLRGFTLAEVLITLGIIGVVAALTIPTLMQKTDERETVAKLRKFYSAMQNAGKMVEIEYGTVDKWDLTPTVINDNNNITDEEKDAAWDSVDLYWQRYAKYLNFQSVKTYKSVMNGNYDKYVYSLDGSAQVSPLMNFITLNDGIVIRTTWFTNSCNTYDRCGNFSIDVNGDKGPNVVGRDVFFFNINKTGASPFFNHTMGDAFAPNCADKDNANGYGCTAWVVYRENMDYLHCSDLSWDGKTKCD
ncbi:type II secretion system protein, partial [bacterium]|nr:type II secretion system protein [bacterium]